MNNAQTSTTIAVRSSFFRADLMSWSAASEELAADDTMPARTPGGMSCPPSDHSPSWMITLSMQALLNDGDEVLIPAPDYPLWTAAVKLAGGNPVHYLCDEEAEWYPDVADVRSKVTARTKGLVIINPNNPTGALYPKEILWELVKIAQEYGLVLFADEIYDRLLFDGREHASVASLTDDVLVVTLNGLSKSHRIAGFRSGWMVLSGNKEGASGYIEGINMLASMRLCANVPSQYVVPKALDDWAGEDALMQPGGRLYEQRECVCKAIGEIPGLSVVKPKAAFYVFPKIDVKQFDIMDDEVFVLRFLQEKQVLLVHGKGFNWPEPDHFRIVYLPEVGELQDAMGRLKAFLGEGGVGRWQGCLCAVQE